MSPLKFLATHVFAVSLAEIGRWCGDSRASVWKWAGGVVAPPLERLRPVLKAEAAARGLPWADAWLFELPPLCGGCTLRDGDQSGCAETGCARIAKACAAARAGDRDGAEAWLFSTNVHLPSAPSGAACPRPRIIARAGTGGDGEMAGPDSANRVSQEAA